VALGQLGLDRAGAATDDEASTAFGDELFEVMGGKGAHLGWVTAMAFAPAAAMVQRLCCVDLKEYVRQPSDQRGERRAIGPIQARLPGGPA
jgi:hypothetical protein